MCISVQSASCQVSSTQASSLLTQLGFQTATPAGHNPEKPGSENPAPRRSLGTTLSPRAPRLSSAITCAVTQPPFCHLLSLPGSPPLLLPGFASHVNHSHVLVSVPASGRPQAKTRLYLQSFCSFLSSLGKFLRVCNGSFDVSIWLPIHGAQDEHLN